MLKSIKGITVTLPVPGTDKTADVTVIGAIQSRYGIIQDYISDAIIETGRFFEEQEVERIVADLKEGSLFVDVGANLGTFTAAAKAVGAKTISIEPQAILQKSLKKNAKGGEIHAVGCGTSKEPLTVHETFMRHPKRGTIMVNLGGNDLLGDQGRMPTSEKVAIKTLDEIVGDRSPDVIKIDVEGMEADVLHSGIECIKRCSPILYLEQNHGYEVAASWNILRPLGYQITDVLGDMNSSVVIRYAR